MSRPKVALVDAFAELPDPRVDRTKKHRLSDIVVIAVCAVIAGADSFEEIERFGQAKRDWLAGFWTCPTASPATTRSTGCSPPWTGRRSRPASRGWAIGQTRTSG
jgi:DDE_Tnp_1-associated